MLLSIITKTRLSGCVYIDAGPSEQVREAERVTRDSERDDFSHMLKYLQQHSSDEEWWSTDDTDPQEW